jgi:hypothetical protein
MRTIEDPVTQDAPVGTPRRAAASDRGSAPDRVVPGRAQRPRPTAVRTRRTKVSIRQIGIWPVFKFSVLFSFCAMLVVYLALVIIFFVMQAAGMIEAIEEVAYDLFATGEKSTRGSERLDINWLQVYTVMFFGGAALSFVWALITTFGALIYNLISDIVGGVEVTLAERRRR